jgi:hypothetical protein
MRKRIFLVLVLFMGCMFLSNEAFSAWTQPKGHSYNQLTYAYYKTTQKFTTLSTENDEIVDTNHHIVRQDTEEFNSKKISYYGEYGITDKLTIFLSGGYDWQTSNDNIKFGEEDGPSGIGDINIGLRHSLIDNIAGTGILMSVQGEVKIPEAYDYGNPTTHLSLGDGQYDASLALLFGRGLGKGYIWLNALYKYRFENDEFDPQTFKPSDRYKIGMGGGYAVTSWLSIRGLIEWTESLGDAEVSDELLAANWPTGGLAKHDDVVVIKDSLGLEPNILSAGIDLAFNVMPKSQVVFSYVRDLTGPWEGLETKDYSLGETFSAAFVYMH